MWQTKRRQMKRHCGMRRLIAATATGCASMLLASCMNFGHEYNRDEATISRLVPGTTSCDEALAIIGGEPFNVTTQADGSRMITFARMQSRASPYMYAGSVGMLIAGATGESLVNSDTDMLTLTCDADGVLTDYQTQSGRQ